MFTTIQLFLVTFALILLMILMWFLVQHFARLFAINHPEFGSVREEGSGCGSTCKCETPCLLKKIKDTFKNN